MRGIDEAYDMVNAEVADLKRSQESGITMSDYGFPTFRCEGPVSDEDVKALDDEE